MDLEQRKQQIRERYGLSQGATDIEQIDELSRDTLQSYLSKNDENRRGMTSRIMRAGRNSPEGEKLRHQNTNRLIGRGKAQRKLAPKPASSTEKRPSEGEGLAAYEKDYKSKYGQHKSAWEETHVDRDQIDEISKQATLNYMGKAQSDVHARYVADPKDPKVQKRLNTLQKTKVKFYKKHPVDYSTSISKDYHSKSGRYMGDSVEHEGQQIDELSKDTVKSYLEKAKYKHSINKQATERREREGKYGAAFTSRNRYRKLEPGIARAEKRLGEEVEQIDELSKDTLRSYIDKKIALKHKIGVEASKAYSSGDHKRGGELSHKINKGEGRIMQAHRKIRGEGRPKASYPLGGYDPVSNRSYSEGVEQIDELKKSTLASYSRKALDQMNKASDRAGEAAADRNDQVAFDSLRTADKREQGYKKAMAKLKKST
jgi:hypothetical protein